jgi:hypothetical protein
MLSPSVQEKIMFRITKGRPLHENRNQEYYNEDFICNLDDRKIVEEITGGEPTYHNQTLYRNIEENLNKMQWISHSSKLVS